MAKKKSVEVTYPSERELEMSRIYAARLENERMMKQKKRRRIARVVLTPVRVIVKALTVISSVMIFVGIIGTVHGVQLALQCADAYRAGTLANSDIVAAVLYIGTPVWFFIVSQFLGRLWRFLNRKTEPVYENPFDRGTVIVYRDSEKN